MGGRSRFVGLLRGLFLAYLVVFGALGLALAARHGRALAAVFLALALLNGVRAWLCRRP